MTPFRDATTVFVRESLPTWRAPAGLAFSMLQPLVFLALFGPLLSGVGGMPGGSSWQWFVPAILLMLALFGTTGTGYTLLTEMQTGSHERLMVTPMNRSSILAGRSLKDVVELLAQAVLIIALTIPLGFTPHPMGALLGLGLLALVGLGVGALSHALAIACRRHEEMFYMVQQTLLFPLLLLSGLLLPLELGPAWMSTVGALNPLTYVVEAMRALFAGTVADPVVLWGWVAAALLAVIGLSLGARGMRRAQS
ncbi:ABC transporter permease [Halostreptopolyspora alba]|uniref:Transport permease protein n=1 Tax=Halostreptopolyspora alba TaxID=2487137 RepID=A0A3N0E4T8_9ACTN|nr:ABC transporter permease [Nocardiopsaceae bacterium YIM 96095]